MMFFPVSFDIIQSLIYTLFRGYGRAFSLGTRLGVGAKP
jgi:hypothetical protein